MKILTIIGARPQFVKAAVVSRAIARHNAAVRSTSGQGTFQTSEVRGQRSEIGQPPTTNHQPPTINEILIHTGQHFDANMSQVFFDEMEIPHPEHHLGIGGGTHGQNTGRMIEKIEEVLLAEKPDRVLVYGDTDSTLAGALAAVKLHVPVAHVEAGLRSFNRRMPEEINRILTDHVADLLFAPTDVAVENLKKEGISGAGVIRTGDVMFDAARYYAPRARKPDLPGLPDAGFVLCTLHRAENTDDPARLANIMRALQTIAREVPVVLPLHPRTRTRLQPSNVQPLITNNQRPTTNNPLSFLPPVGYFEMIWLLQNCRLVLTDSGGVQKEAYFFRKPCVTLRDQTEWVELVEAGVNTLVGADPDRILSGYAAMNARSIPEPTLYGDGHAAEKIVEILNDEC